MRTSIDDLPQVDPGAFDPFQVDPSAWFGEGLQFLADQTTTPVIGCDLGGVAFSCAIYPEGDLTRTLVRCTSYENTLRVGDDASVLLFAVPAGAWRSYYGDAVGMLIASDGTHAVNLSRRHGPLQFVIQKPVKT